MAYDPSLTQSAAIIIALALPFMGRCRSFSNILAIRRLSMHIVIYTTSLIFIWIAGFALDGSALIAT